MTKKLLISLLVSIIGVLKLLSMPVDTCVKLILEKDKIRMDTAIKYIIQEKDVSTFAFVSAIAEKRLYNLNGKAVTKFPSNDTIYEVYPSQNIIANAFTDNIEEVILSRQVRTKFNSLSKYANLVNPKADVRNMGFQSFKTNADLNDVEILSKIMETETNPKVYETAKETIYAIWLLSSDKSLQLQALDSLSKSTSYSVLETIETYLKATADVDENHLLALAIHKKIIRKQKFISTFQNLFSGFSLGSILLLVALGLSIVYGLGGVINMSHGESMMIGAYATYSVQQLFVNYFPNLWFDAYFLLSLPVAFLVAGVFGLIIERLVIQYLYNKPLESLLATWGISLILIQLSRSMFGDVTAVKAPEFLSGGVEIMRGLILPFNRLFIIGLTIVTVTFTYLGFFRTRLGLKIRAVTQNRNMSSSLGISTKRIDSTTFFLGSGLAGIAGCAMTLIGNVVPNMGQTYIVDSFLVVVVGGVGKLIGTIISAMGIGIFSKIFEFFFEAVYGKVIMLVIIIFFLQYKPKGLFPDKGRTSEDD